MNVTRRTIAQQDLDAFAALSGDDNPIHVDPQRAAQLTFGTTVAHGMLLATVCDGALRASVDWPWRAMALTFPAPTPVGSEVELHLRPSGRRATIDVRLPDGASGCEGAAATDVAGLADGVLDVPSAAAPDGSLGRLTGTSAHLERDVTADDLAAYAQLAGVDATDVTAVPLPMVTALFSCLLGTRLPGPGTNYLKQSFALDELPAPGALRADVEVRRVRPEQGLVDLATTCSDRHGRQLGRGRALVLAADVDVDATLARLDAGTDTARTTTS